ncbi:MAG: hypothetical protein SFV55_03865 [Haliscomenobacter sp.]|uniref:hypothetical protein n=1 Tax=Haliscomenobacter sp. TaxID=2717303 RepID=UPI0029BB25BC|nr:hypothetical protein [Haliscomenobacter sp.]MDX2067537.1 hypothetical protein [Haliscomenobacter sp.]
MKLLKNLGLGAILWMMSANISNAQVLRDTFIQTSAEDWRSSPWKEYQSLEGKFRVLVPGEFAKAVDSVQTPLGKLAYYILVYNNTQKNAENLFYMITFCDYPSGTVHSDSTELLKDFFDASIDQATSSVKGELAYQADIVQQGFPGKIWRINYLRDQAVIKTKAFMVRNRFYTIQTVTLKDMAINAASDRFFDSFLIL